jgi:hypothetical protein
MNWLFAIRPSDFLTFGSIGRIKKGKGNQSPFAFLF